MRASLSSLARVRRFAALLVVLLPAAGVQAKDLDVGVRNVVNEGERRLLEDVEAFLGELVPDEGWAHDEIDDNADSHLRALLLGPGETIPVADGGLQLGTWQSILLVELDGPRSRSLSVTVQD